MDADEAPTVSRGADPDHDGDALLDAVTAAGAAVDIAQVLSDHVAGRIVAMVAGGGGRGDDREGPGVRRLAVESTRIAGEVERAGRRYEQARREHLDDLDCFDRPADVRVLDELASIVAAGVRAERAAGELEGAVLELEQQLRRRTETTRRPDGAMRARSAAAALEAPPGQHRLH